MEPTNRFEIRPDNVPIFIATATGCGEQHFLGMILNDRTAGRLNSYIRWRNEKTGMMDSISIEGRTTDIKNTLINRWLLRRMIRKGIKAAARVGKGEYKELTVRTGDTLDQALDKIIGSEIQFT